MPHYDVIVIGAGPAGSSASALLAQRGWRVLLLEKSRFPREKLCGEFISPEATPVFERIGVLERIRAAGAQPISRMILYAPDGRGVEIPTAWFTGSALPALGLSRAQMDAILLDRARESGVTVREGFHVSPRLARRGEISLIEGKADGVLTEQYSGNLVIDASGRGGLFTNATIPSTSRLASSRLASSRLAGSRLFGCKVHVRRPEAMGETGALFFFGDGYGGMSDVEGGRTNLCFITTEATLRAAKGDRQALLEMTLLENQAARRALRGAVFDGDWVGTGPLTYGAPPAVAGVLAVGDAGAFIDPFTGSGMLLALSGGVLAAEIINEAFTSDERRAERIALVYRQIRRRQLGWRFRACATLRTLALQPASRNLLATLLPRSRTLTRMIALSTRHGGVATR